MVLGNVNNVCAGCEQTILDRIMLSIDGKLWHEYCATCNVCMESLDHSCYVKNEKLYCEYDYRRLFGRRCTGCGQPILRNQSILTTHLTNSISHTDTPTQMDTQPDQTTETHTEQMKNKLYFHELCFTCCQCQRLLCSGELYTLHGTFPMCLNDDLHCQKSISPKISSEIFNETKNFGQNSSVNSNLNSDSFDLLVRSHEDSVPLLESYSPLASSDDGSSRNTPIPVDDEDMYELDSDSGSGKNSKRPRTILTSTQRRRFKAVFEINPKPARKMRETLAEETGLNMRVVQVWFQNQRAKMKKLARREAQDTLQKFQRRAYAICPLSQEFTMQSITTANNYMKLFRTDQLFNQLQFSSSVKEPSSLASDTNSEWFTFVNSTIGASEMSSTDTNPLTSTVSAISQKFQSPLANPPTMSTELGDLPPSNSELNNPPPNPTSIIKSEKTLIPPLSVNTLVGKSNSSNQIVSYLRDPIDKLFSMQHSYFLSN